MKTVQRLRRRRGHRHPFGDFQGEPARVDLEVAECASDHLLQGVILDVARRYVERDRHIEPVLDPFAKLRERGIDDPRRKRMDDSRLLGHRDEAVRGHQALPRVVPADERLDRVDRARRQGDLGLVMEDQLTLRDRAAQLAGEP